MRELPVRDIVILHGAFERVPDKGFKRPYPAHRLVQVIASSQVEHAVYHASLEPKLAIARNSLKLPEGWKKSATPMLRYVEKPSSRLDQLSNRTRYCCDPG
jgi:hypothetical protein